MGVVMMRKFAGAPKCEGDLQKPKAHQIGAERNAEVNQPARNFEIWRDLIGIHQSDHEFRAHRSDHRGKKRTAEQPEQNDHVPPRWLELINENIDPYMDPGSHAISRPEF